jgi:chromosome segregation ATPase
VERETAALQSKKMELLRVDGLVADLTRQVADARSQAQTAKGKKEIVSSQISGINSEIFALENELKMANASPTEYDNVLRDLAARKNNLQDDISALLVKEADMQNKMKEIRAEEEKRKQKVFFLQDEMQALQSKLAAASQAKNSEQVEMAKIETRAEDLAHEVVTEMGVAVESILAKGIELVEVLALENLAVEIQKNKYKLSLIGGIDEEVVKEFEETKARHDVLDRELLDLQKASADLEKLVLELDEMMKKKKRLCL